MIEILVFENVEIGRFFFFCLVESLVVMGCELKL